MIKNYIKKVLYDILKEPEMQVKLSEYIVKTTSSVDLNVFDIMKSPYCYEIKLKVTYIDADEDIEMYKYLEGKPNTFFHKLPGFNLDAGTISHIDLYARFKYKGQKKLQSHTFTKYNHQYSNKILDKVKDELLTWYDKHPEMKL